MVMKKINIEEIHQNNHLVIYFGTDFA